MFGFLVTSLIVHKVLSKFHQKAVSLIIAIAFLFITLATFMIGPSSILKMPNSLPLMIAGLLLTGLAGAFSAIPSYDEMRIPFI